MSILDPSLRPSPTQLRIAGLFTAVGLALTFGLGDLLLERVGDPLSRDSERRLVRTLTIATVAYLSAAAVNSTVSVLKTSEMEASFFVVGGSVTVGEALDPIHDLVEQLSSILTFCIVSVGLQRLILSVAAEVSLMYIVAPGLLLLAGAALWRGSKAGTLRRLGRALVVVGLLGRFGLPAVFVVSDEFSERTLAPRIAAAQAELEQAQSDLNTLVFGSTESVTHRIDRAKVVAEQALTAIVDLMVAFLFRVVLLPILLLYLIAQLPSVLLRSAPAVVARFEGREGERSA